MDYNPYHEEKEYGIYGADPTSDEAEWIEDPEAFQNNYVEKQEIMDDLALSQYIEQMALITTKFVQEDDYEGIAAAEIERHYQAFRSYSRFIDDIHTDLANPIINDFFKGDTSCAW